MTRDDFLQMDEDQLLSARDDIMARKRANADLMAWATSVPGKREIEEISVRREAIRDEYGQALLDLASEPDTVIVRAMVAIRAREQECNRRHEILRAKRNILAESLDTELEACNDVLDLRREDSVSSR